jgi:hypothetical protein
MTWKHPSSFFKKKLQERDKFGRGNSDHFLDMHGIRLVDFIPRGAKINVGRYLG